MKRQAMIHNIASCDAVIMPRTEINTQYQKTSTWLMCTVTVYEACMERWGRKKSEGFVQKQPRSKLLSGKSFCHLLVTEKNVNFNLYSQD